MINLNNLNGLDQKGLIIIEFFLKNNKIKITISSMCECVLQWTLNIHDSPLNYQLSASSLSITISISIKEG